MGEGGATWFGCAGTAQRAYSGVQTAARGTCRMECRSAVGVPSSAWKGRGMVCHGFIAGMLAVGHGSGPKGSVKFVGSHTHTHMWRGTWNLNKLLAVPLWVPGCGYSGFLLWWIWRLGSYTHVSKALLSQLSAGWGHGFCGFLCQWLCECTCVPKGLPGQLQGATGRGRQWGWCWQQSSLWVCTAGGRWYQNCMSQWTPPVEERAATSFPVESSRWAYLTPQLRIRSAAFTPATGEQTLPLTGWW